LCYRLLSENLKFKICTKVKRIFGPKKDDVAGSCRRLYNEELRNVYASLNIVTVIKSMRMRWAGHVARIG